MLSLLLSSLSHITLNPDFGAESGGYFHTTLRVPHGSPGMHTTRLVVDVPHGLLVAKPEVPDGWTALIETRTLSDSEVYVSHGKEVRTAPHRITLSAEDHGEGVHDDHLLNVDVQTKLGCVYKDEESNTVWNGEYTLWWKVEQHCEDASGKKEVLKWDGIQKDADGVSPSWTSLPEGERPAPYLHLSPGTRCSVDHSGPSQEGGLVWFGDFSPPEPVGSGEPSSPILSTSYVLSILSTMLSVFSLGLWTAFFCFRCADRKRFGEALIGPLVDPPKV